jgi:stage V sporulation protein D (sporulation-specific penicillin-binding protein)
VTTLDTNVQYYLEKGVEAMVDKFDAKNGATGIVMDVNTGGILGMASYPTYDLNNPFTIYDSKLAASSSRRRWPPWTRRAATPTRRRLADARLRQWRNKCINDTYEPGSTFKPITLATALEEGVVSMNTTFYCSGSIRVPGLEQAHLLLQSLRPRHRDAEGGHRQLLQPGVYHHGPEDRHQPPSTSTSGLRPHGAHRHRRVRRGGQHLRHGEGASTPTWSPWRPTPSARPSTSRPLQLIRAQAACVNGGYLRTPYLVEQVLDDDGNVVSQHDTTPVRQVISSETSAKVRECLEYVVASGTGKNGQVAGYRIGGKTGTADKTGNKNRDDRGLLHVLRPSGRPPDHHARHPGHPQPHHGHLRLRRPDGGAHRQLHHGGHPAVSRHPAGLHLRRPGRRRRHRAQLRGLHGWRRPRQS